MEKTRKSGMTQQRLFSLLLLTFIAVKKIDYDGSAPEGQNTNAFAETHWKKMVIIARKLLIHAPLSKEFAIFALHYACKIHDVLPVKGLVDSENNITTPFAKWYVKTPKMNRFKVFGCPSVYKRYGKVRKWAQDGQRAIFLGFPHRQDG